MRAFLDRLGPRWENDAAKTRYARSLAAACEAKFRSTRPDELFSRAENDDVLQECFQPALAEAIALFPAKLRAESEFEHSHGPGFLDSPASGWAGGCGFLAALVKKNGLAPEKEEDAEEEEEAPSSFMSRYLNSDMSWAVLDHPKFSDSPTVGELVAWYQFYTTFHHQYTLRATVVHQRKLRETLAKMRQEQQEREQARGELKDALRKRLAQDGLAGASVAELKKVCKACDLAHKTGTKAQLLGRLQKYVDGTGRRRKSPESSADKFLSLFDRPTKRRRR